MTFTAGTSGNPGGQPKHGQYRARAAVCEAPGCGRPFTARKLTSRYCSVRCMTKGGGWSYPANREAAAGLTEEAR